MKVKGWQGLFLLALIGLLGLSWPFSWLFSPTNDERFGSHAWVERQIEIMREQADNISTHVLRLGLVAYVHAREKGLDDKGLLTIIDYSKPSTERRLWVFDLKKGRTLFNTWVSHGKNSGGVKATSFSNIPGSLQSSLGLFLTQNTYQGNNGYSLRLQGLEQGFNDKAFMRDIVIHGAWYVHPKVIARYGQLGRSWGCPAVSEALVRPLVDTIKENTLVFVYYPDRRWLSQSEFLVS